MGDCGRPRECAGVEVHECREVGLRVCPGGRRGRGISACM